VRAPRDFWCPGHLAPLALVVLFIAPDRVQAQPQSTQAAPFHRAGPAEYVGPGRGEAAPEDLDEIRLGYFGPSDPADPEAGDAWLAADWAIERANAEGGYQGLPFRLVPAWSEDPWGSGIAQLARLAYAEAVWGMVGGIDGASTHLAEQVVTKARLTLISPGGTDESVNLTNVPWMLSCLPPDSRQAEAIGRTLLDTAADGSFVVISANDHDSHMTMVQVRAFLGSRHATPRLDLEFRAGARDLTAVVAEAVGVVPEAVLLVSSAHDAARLVRLLRPRFAGPILGSGRLGLSRFREEAGPAAEGTILPLLREPSEDWRRFAREFRDRFGREPDYLAGQTYDAVRVLVQAIRKGGLNRPHILDALQALGPWRGVSGVIAWDPQGRNARPVGMVRVESGRLVPLVPFAVRPLDRRRSVQLEEQFLPAHVGPGADRSDVGKASLPPHVPIARGVLGALDEDGRLA